MKEEAWSDSCGPNTSGFSVSCASLGLQVQTQSSSKIYNYLHQLANVAIIWI